MASEKNNPYGIHVGMKISVGALQEQPTKNKRMKNSEDLQLGSTEYFHGISPPYKFIDEKYFDQWEEKQVEYKKRLINISRRRIERTKEAFEYEHNRLLSSCGPEWYQELSPNQKDIVDHLNSAINKDLLAHSTSTTQSSLSHLGMRPLPNDSQLWRALIKSYGCPIEFLLILYDLIEPHRKYYSINDRLLLSGVAHLSLRHILREMHVRFPSPPRAEPKALMPKRPAPKKKFSHVYLIPFTFKWPIRNRNIYKNPVIQKPECPYFSYVCNMEKERVICSDEIHQPERPDKDIIVPCDLFDDHLKAEEVYNSIFIRHDKCKYIIMRPNIYESRTPKAYPGVLPQYMTKNIYPLPIKLFFDMKIYQEINSKNDKSRKVVRAICEARKIPVGRPGQKMGQTSIAKYVYIKNIGPYSLEDIDLNIIGEDSRGFADYPCSVCGGPENKQAASEMKPQKVKKYIQHHKKPKAKRIYKDWSSSESIETEVEKEVVYLNEETMNLVRENKKYFETWKKFFANIERLEKLRLEARECICPDKTRDKSKTKPQNNCTCAIWNLPPVPKMIPPSISCECYLKVQEPPKEDKCDCKKKANEKAIEACEQCGVVKVGAYKNEGSDCNCTENICGNCVEQTTGQLPLKNKECLYEPELPTEGREVTVGYVFIENQPQKADTFKPEEKLTKESLEKCLVCKKQFSTEKSTKKKEHDKTDRKKIHETCRNGKKQTNRTNNTMKTGYQKCNIHNEEEQKKLSKKLTQSSMACENFSKLDNCEEETQKLLKLLKCSCSKCRDLRKKYRVKYIHAGTRDACGGILPVIGGTLESHNKCACLEKFEERVKGVNEYQRRMRVKLDLKSYKYRYIINGVTQTQNGPVYNISGIVPKHNEFKDLRDCICDTERDEKFEKEKRDMMDEKIKKGYKYVISGVKEDSPANQYILGQVIKECQCSKVFEQFMEEHNECLVKYEKYLQYMRKEIQEYTKEIDEKYSFSPFTAQKLLEEEIKRLKGPPGLPVPEGKSEYVVSGVQVNDMERSFVLGGVLLKQKESEECIVAVQSYTQSSSTEGISKCQRTYLCNYMTFGKNCGNPFQISNDTNMKNSSEELICQCISYESLQSTTSLEEEHDENEDEKSEGCACECPCAVQYERPDECSCEVASEEDDSCVCSDSPELEEQETEVLDGCTCADIEESSSGTASDPCLCGVKNCGCQIDDVCVKECFYGPMEAWWSDTELKKKKKREMKKKKTLKASSMSSIGGSSERYVILKGIPKSSKEQEKILKKLLRGLAIDGFPLANLPDCHKIPYFWLWLQFRMRKQWNFEDGVKNFNNCQCLWNHISLCKRKIPLPKLPKHCKTEKYTWKDAEIVAKMMTDIKQKYYNRMRKAMVDFAREFYITLSPYQFPRPPHLNHYFFAYQPSKLENVIAENVWQPDECKDPRHRKSCFCK